MSTPMIGEGVIDLKARLTNKKLREMLAEGMAKNQMLATQCNTLGEALATAVELLQEARGCLNEASGAESYAELVDRITAWIGPTGG